MQRNNSLLVDTLFLEADTFLKIKQYKAIRILICILFLVYVDYRIMMAEWDGDLTLLEKTGII